MLKKFVKIHKLSFAILIFIILFGTMHYIKPALIYNEQGGFRQFGLGYKNKTILPIWIFAIIFSIFSYLGVMYYIQFM
jgi:hypothetical protein